MNPYRLFSDRAYVFDSNKKIKKNTVAYDIVTHIIDESKIDLDVEDIYFIGGNQDYDEYKISDKDFLYTLKLSLDEDCEILKNEITFLESNKNFPLCPIYLDSGKVRIGDNILFLISTFEDGFDIRDIGILSPIENWDSFFYTLHHFSNLKTERSIDQYVDLVFNRNLPQNWSDFLKIKISNTHDIDILSDMFSVIQGELNNNFDKTILLKDKTCHGDLTLKNVIFRDEYYKFKNIGFNFIGNPIIDVCMFSLSSGYSIDDSTLFFKKYCDYNEIDFLSSKDEFDYCMKFSVCLFLGRIFFDFLVEQCVFSGERPEKLAEFATDFSKFSHFLKKYKNLSEVGTVVGRVITSPILGYSKQS